MKNLFIAVSLTLFGATLPNLASAQSDLQCPSITTVGWISEETPVDISHQPIAYPGAFGGEVTCLLQRNGNFVERLFAEYLTPGEVTIDDIYYLNDGIIYYVKYQGEGEVRNEVVVCTRRDAGGLVCTVDLAVGQGFRLMRFFDADLQLVGVRLVAIPDKGLINEFAWDLWEEPVLNDPNTTLVMTAILPETNFSVELTLLDESEPGTPMFGISGQPAFDFMMLIFENDQPIKIETVVTKIQGTQVTTSSIDKDIPAGTIGFMLGRLGAIEQLMVAGFEESKLLEF